MDTDLLLTAAAVTATTVACTAAMENTLYRQSVLSSVSRTTGCHDWLSLLLQQVKLLVH